MLSLVWTRRSSSLKQYNDMSNQEIVQMLKHLSKLDDAKRLYLENTLGDTPFYSGLISFSANPIADAIQAYRWMIRDWSADSLMQQQYPEEVTAVLAHANAMLALLQREFSFLID